MYIATVFGMDFIDTVPSIGSQCWHLILVVSMYVAHFQNSFLHFKTVMTYVTFHLLAVVAFLLSSNMPIADLTVIVVSGDDLLSRFHTLHFHAENFHQIIIEYINISAYALYKTVKKGLCRAMS